MITHYDSLPWVITILLVLYCCRLHHQFLTVIQMSCISLFFFSLFFKKKIVESVLFCSILSAWVNTYVPISEETNDKGFCFQ